MQKALLCQKAEHDFAGMPGGIMDQFTAIFGRSGHVLLLDCQSLTHELVASPPGEPSLLVINTMVQHALTDGSYASRRDDCLEVARLLGGRTARHHPTTRRFRARPFA